MDIKKEEIGNVIVLTINGNLLGEIDSKPIQEYVASGIEENKPNFIFDVEEMNYINSTGLSILISTLTKSRKAGGDLYLVNISSQLETLLKITKLENIFQKSETVEEAIEKFK